MQGVKREDDAGGRVAGGIRRKRMKVRSTEDEEEHEERE